MKTKPKNRHLKYRKLISPADASDKAHDNARLMIAAMSPKDYAKAMATKASFLLKAVNDLWERRPEGSSWVCSCIRIPCPHCSVSKLSGTTKCQSCLWTRAASAAGMDIRWRSCMHLRFGGVTMDEVSSRNKYVKVVYYPRQATVAVKTPKKEMDSGSMKVAEEEFRRCVKYLEAHVKWAGNTAWGTKAKKGQ